MFKIFKMYRSGFYKFLKNKPTKRSLENIRLDVEIKVIWEKNRKIYGYPRITAQLRKNGWIIGKTRVAERMNLLKIKSNIRKKYKRIYISNNSRIPSPNILNRNFNVSKPNNIWVSDITLFKLKINGIICR